MTQRHYILIPESLRETCNALAVTIGTDPEGKLDTFTPTHQDTDGNTYCYRDGILSPDPLTWERRRVALETASDAGHLPGAVWLRVYNSGPRQGEIVAASDPEMIGRQWNVAAFFSTLHLIPILASHH